MTGFVIGLLVAALGVWVWTWFRAGARPVPPPPRRRTERLYYDVQGNLRRIRHAAGPVVVSRQPSRVVAFDTLDPSVQQIVRDFGSRQHG